MVAAKKAEAKESRVATIMLKEILGINVEGKRDANNDKIYEEEILGAPTLPKTQNSKPFRNQFQQNDDPNVISFWNDSGDTRLVVPAKRKSKNYLS